MNHRKNTFLIMLEKFRNYSKYEFIKYHEMSY